MYAFEHHFLCLNSHLTLKLIFDRYKSEDSQRADEHTALAILNVVITGQFCCLFSENKCKLFVALAMNSVKL